MKVGPAVYPASGRTAWILAQRPARTARPDPFTPHAVFLERERLASGELAASGVVLLTNRECPWRCVMCDLWKAMTPDATPPGAVPAQVQCAVERWAAAGAPPVQVKLYNSGSFFDSRAVPLVDYPAVARHVAFARHVVVESHPLLVGDRVLRFRDLLCGSLEVGLGLETSNPDILEKLNKQFDLTQFARAAGALAAADVGMRAFVLVNPPFLGAGDGVASAVNTVEFAFSCGASAVVLIPTRAGNGAMERLRESGEWVPPTLTMVEAAQRRALALRGGRVFADTWGLDAFAACGHCFAARRDRIEAMNLAQVEMDPVHCAVCGA